MERTEPQPSQPNQLEQVLRFIPENQLLQFTKDGYRLFELVETQTSDGWAAQTLLVQEGVSINELKREAHNAGLAEPISSDEFRVWKEDLVTPAAIKTAAIDQLKRRAENGDIDTLVCANCKGDSNFDFNGSCAFCGGSLKTTKYPHILITNELSGAHQELVLDLAALIANGELTAEHVTHGNSYENGFEVGEKHILFDIETYIYKKIVEMGIEIDNAARVVDNGSAIRGLEDAKRLNATTGRVPWRKRKGEDMLAGSRQAHKPRTADEILDQAQLEIAYAFAWPYGKIKDINGVVTAEEWIIRPLRSIDEAFEDLKTAVAKYNYTLGFNRCFIATGETGPTFYLLDNDGNVVLQLSNEYGIREALETAWLTFQTFQREPPQVV